MASTSIRRKVFVNKNNKQLTIPLSKREIRKINPTIKFNRKLFVTLEIFNEEEKR